MNFNTIANSLLKHQVSTKGDDKDSKSNGTIIEDLREAGFSPREIFQEMRSIFDTTEDDTTKKQMLEMAVKMHGLYTQEETKRIPNIILNVVGDKTKLNEMLCPPLRE